MRCDGDGSTEEEELRPDDFRGFRSLGGLSRDATEVEEFFGAHLAWTRRISHLI